MECFAVVTKRWTMTVTSLACPKEMLDDFDDQLFIVVASMDEPNVTEFGSSYSSRTHLGATTRYPVSSDAANFLEHARFLEYLQCFLLF